MYTGIPPFEVLCETTDFCLKANKVNFITTDLYDTKWSTRNIESSVIFTKTTLQIVKFPLSNCFFKVFQQVIGIPKELNPTPFFASLIFYNYENKLSSEITTNWYWKGWALWKYFQTQWSPYCTWLFCWVWKKLPQNLSLWYRIKERTCWLFKKD